MNSRLTWVLGILLAVATIVHVLPDPDGAPLKPEERWVMPEARQERVSKIEIARKGSGPAILERTQDGVGPYWRLLPADRPADEEAMQPILWGLDRFLTQRALPPGEAGADPKITGLDDPRLRVTLHHPGGKDVLRFGREAPIQTDFVFYQREGDPRIFLVEKETFIAYDKTAFELRSRKLLRYPPHRVARVELRRKYVRVGSDGTQKADYETAVAEKLEEGGWFLTAPRKERLDDLRVGTLVSDLARLEAKGYREAGDDPALDQPLVVVSLTLQGGKDPIVVHFGAPMEEGRGRAVMIAGSGEVARISMENFDALPLQLKSLRSDKVHPFGKAEVVRLEVEARGVGRTILEVREGGGVPPTPVWEVTEPAGIRSEKERVEAYVEQVMSQRIREFLGPLDPKEYRLDPPDVALKIKTRDGKEHLYRFGLRGEMGLMRREGDDEVVEVRGPFVAMLRGVELPFLHDEVFTVPRDKITGYAFQAAGTERLKPLSYEIRREGERWTFADPAYGNRKADPARVDAQLGFLHHIRTSGYVGRDEETVAKYRLKGEGAHAVLKVFSGGEPAVFYISEDQGGGPRQRVYCARMEGRPVVFRIHEALVEALREIPLLKD